MRELELLLTLEGPFCTGLYRAQIFIPGGGGFALGKGETPLLALLACLEDWTR